MPKPSGKRKPEKLKEETPPSESQCLALLEKYDAQPPVVAHSKVVAAIAFALARKLEKKGVKVDARLARSGGLLHDIAKLEKGKKGEWKPMLGHAKAGAEILRKEGLPREARIAETHVAEPEEAKPKTWEEKLVLYADKRVEWNKIVSLRERFKALGRRYAHLEGAVERINSTRPRLEGLEKKIFSKIGRRPEEMESIISEETEKRKEEGLK